MSELESLISEYSSGTLEHPTGVLGTILLVDDDQGIVRSLRDILTRKGFKVITCLNAEDVCTHLKDNYDLVILDIKLPKVGGKELYAIIKTHKDVPIIFHSAYAGDDQIECKKLKPFAYIHKGTSDSYWQLNTAIERALNE